MIRNTPASPPMNGSRKKKDYILEWPSQSLGVNPTEILWHDLKQSVHAENSSVAEFKIILQKKSEPKFIHSDVKD